MKGSNTMRAMAAAISHMKINCPYSFTIKMLAETNGCSINTMTAILEHLLSYSLISCAFNVNDHGQRVKVYRWVV